MIIYGSSMSPFVRKTMAFAAEKQVEFELVQATLGSSDPAFREASPFGKMPAMRDGDFTLADSTAICLYLEALHPTPELVPTDAKLRGKAIWFDEFADTIVCTCGGKMFFNRIVSPIFLKRAGDLAMADKAENEELPPILDYLETQIPDSDFLVGDRLTIADLAVASPFANFQHLGLTIDPSRHPKVASYTAAILARPSFAITVERETRALARATA
ncbi:glutathione S-transferase family protein [Glacieibacterium sp.]|uniref:glutathione S-transferase family protein n=1 Tax=Glacieibacterium sp. TaxID=2860237 RepID=UPI003AFF6B43